MKVHRIPCAKKLLSLGFSEVMIVYLGMSLDSVRDEALQWLLCLLYVDFVILSCCYIAVFCEIERLDPEGKSFKQEG